MAADDVKWMDLAEFRDQGYLQEINRRFLHPLGLALAVEVEDGKPVALAGVQDARHDPEGLIFAEGMIDGEKARFVGRTLVNRTAERAEVLGYAVQPVPGGTT